MAVAAEIGEVTQEQAQRLAEEYARKLESRIPTVQAGFTTLQQLTETVQENIENAGSGDFAPFSVHPDQLTSAMEAVIRPYRKAWNEQKVLNALTGTRNVFNGGERQQQRSSR